MKKLCALALALTAFACSQAPDGTPSASDLQSIRNQNTRPAARILTPVKGTIASVQAGHATPPAIGLWTDVTVEYMIPCWAKLESAVASYGRDAEGELEIYSSGFISSTDHSGADSACLAFSMHEVKVAIPGIVAAEGLKLVNLAAAPADVPAKTIQVASIGEAKVVGARSLCPEGVVCAVGGTIVTVEMMMSSCVNRIGPVAKHAVTRNGEDGQPSIDLTMHAIEFVDEMSTRVDCAVTKKNVDVSLPMQFADAQHVSLQLLH